jgi:glycosyltransferase involved in cell wall biosynthesis
MPYFSIVTPTNNGQYLPRLSRSLANQTFKDFEWVVLPNGNATIDLDSLSLEPRIINSSKPDSKLIGLFKKEASMAGKGHVIVEVDHDDELTPDCLEELHKCFKESESIDFVYSNCAEIDFNGKPFVYSDVYGWRNRPFEYNGKKLLELISFEPSAACFSKIWFAPNHVRAWKKSFYEKIGGHNEKMDVLDDHDILCRTYIHGNVKHLDKCLYIYYRHKGNTCYGEKNAFIQEETLNIHDRYIYQLVEKWCDLNNLLKVDLCGGFNPPKGYVSVDLANASICADLNKEWPFQAGQVGLFRAHDALEHLKNPIHVMKEAYRCLSPLGWFLTQTPSTDGRGAFQDPTHISFWNSNSFWYYTKAETAKYIGTPVRFQLNRIKNFFPTEWHKTHNILYVKADLLKISNDIRIPGEISI